MKNGVLNCYYEAIKNVKKMRIEIIQRKQQMHLYQFTVRVTDNTISNIKNNGLSSWTTMKNEGSFGAQKI